MLRHDFENPWGVKDPKGNTRTMSQLLDLAVFPGTQGGPLEHVIAAKAISFGEILTEDFTAYGKQVLSNAQAMAKAFVSRGYNLISDGTDNHLMLIDLRNKNLTGKKAQETLDLAHITLNKNSVPFMISHHFYIWHPWRVPAITTRGMKETDMETIVAMVDKVLMNIDDEKTISGIKTEVKEFMKQFPLYPELG
jgi:glycine hydroxymethyltransferase